LSSVSVFKEQRVSSISLEFSNQFRGHMSGKLFIGNLSFNVTDEGLNEFFASMKIPISNIRIVRDPNTQRSRGFAFADLAAETDMDAAINQLNGQILDGRPLTVTQARQQKPREFRGGEGGHRGGGGGFDPNRNRFGRRSGPRGMGGNRPPRQTE
jgi:RNA recognition motif-containing protein